MLDPARRIAAFNPAAERVTQLAAAAMLGQPVAALPGPLRELAQATLDSGEAIVDRPLVLEFEGKTKVVLFASTVAIRSTGEALVGVLLTFHDLTEAREFERLTERLQRLGMLGVLSAGVVHEIKNALVAVKSFAELLLEKQQDVEMVTLVVQEVNRINSLVGQLLKLAGPARPEQTRSHRRDRNVRRPPALLADGRFLVFHSYDTKRALNDQGRLTLCTRLA